MPRGRCAHDCVGERVAPDRPLDLNWRWTRALCFDVWRSSNWHSLTFSDRSVSLASQRMTVAAGAVGAHSIGVRRLLNMCRRIRRGRLQQERERKGSRGFTPGHGRRSCRLGAGGRQGLHGGRRVFMWYLSRVLPGENFVGDGVKQHSGDDKSRYRRIFRRCPGVRIPMARAFPHVVMRDMVKRVPTSLSYIRLEKAKHSRRLIAR